MLLTVFFCCLCKHVTCSNYWYLFYFHPLHLTEKWDCKQVYWDANSFLPATFEPCEKKKYLPFSYNSKIHYASSILVEIKHLSNLFFHMLTLKSWQRNWMLLIIIVLTWMFLWTSITNPYAIYISSGGECTTFLVSLRTAAHCWEYKLH